MKHRYGKLGTVLVLGTAGVRVQPRYRCMRTPSVPDFFQKKKFQVRVGYGLGTGGAESMKAAKNYVVFRKKLFDSQSLSLYHPPFAATLTRFSLSQPQLTVDEAR